MVPIEIDAIRREQKPLKANCEDWMLTLGCKRFSTGSIGWYGNGKFPVLVGTTYIQCQVQMTITVIGSKPGYSGAPTIASEAAQTTEERLYVDAPPMPLPGAVETLPGVMGKKGRKRGSKG